MSFITTPAAVIATRNLRTAVAVDGDLEGKPTFVLVLRYTDMVEPFFLAFTSKHERDAAVQTLGQALQRAPVTPPVAQACVDVDA